MDSETLSKLFGYNMMAIETNLEGITHEESLFQPQAGGNSINWILGHIVASRGAVMKLVGEDSIWSEEDAAPYGRGSPILNESMARPLEKIHSALTESQNKLLGRLKEMSEEDPTSRQENQEKFEQLAFLQFHEAYHAGQISVMRRLVGKPGAIP